MKPDEINRVIQYVTARTSYDRDCVATIVNTGFGELTSLTETSSQTFKRDSLLEYVTQWTLHQTELPEPMVREILECAGRWLDEMCRTVEIHQPELQDKADN